MSPILVRPVREQLEHDRVIRLLHARYKARSKGRFSVAINPGAEQVAPAGAAPDAQYPDLVLTSLAAGKKLVGVVEVETNESTNQLEAMAQWARLGRLPVEFALYVPSGAAGVARRLCEVHAIGVTEISTYHVVGDEVRFTVVYRTPLADKLAAARAAAAEARRASARAGAVKTPAAKAKAKPKRASGAKGGTSRPVRKPARPAAKRTAKKK